MEVSCSSRIRSAYFRKMRPSSVRITFFEARLKSFFPTSFSNSTMRLVTVDCAMYICSAASVKFFTLQRQINVFSSSVFIEKTNDSERFFQSAKRKTELFRFVKQIISQTIEKIKRFKRLFESNTANFLCKKGFLSGSRIQYNFTLCSSLSSTARCLRARSRQAYL